MALVNSYLSNFDSQFTTFFDFMFCGFIHFYTGNCVIKMDQPISEMGFPIFFTQKTAKMNQQAISQIGQAIKMIGSSISEMD